MIFFGLEVSSMKYPENNVVIIDAKDEKLVIDITSDPPYFIKSKLDSRGGMMVVEHGELRYGKTSNQKTTAKR